MLATWGCTTFPKPTLSLDFLGATSLDSGITFSRASTATYFNSAGVLTTAGSGAARFDYNPSTLQPRGLLIEEQRTNSIRNNTMQGAVAGTPGTVPTNWIVTGSANGITREIVGAGTENGISYLDIRYSGTPTTNVFLVINTEANTQITAANGQSWAASWFVRLVGGSTSNIGVIRINNFGYTAAGAGVAGQGSLIDIQALISANALQTQRYSTAFTFSSASVERVNTNITITGTTGNAIDITLRIGLPQLELGAFATSVIPTTTTALTRNADIASMTGTNFSSWYNASEGTMFAIGSVQRGFREIVGVSEGVGNNRIVIQTGSSSGQRIIVTTLGVQQALQSGSYTLGQTGKFAAAYATNSAIISVNGGISTEGTSVTVPTVTTLNIGNTSNSTGQISGYIQRLAYYPTRLPDATLQALTA